MSDAKYAVIQLQGKQHKVTEGEILVVDKLPEAAGQKIKVTDVLLLNDGKKVTIGTPLVEKAFVSLEVVDQQKGKKIRVATYKSKSRYRRVKGHRQHQTVLKVTKIAA